MMGVSEMSDESNAYIDCEHEFVLSTDSAYWIKRINEDAAKYPDEIKILLTPEQNDGCIKAITKQKFMDIRPEQIKPMR